MAIDFNNGRGQLHINICTGTYTIYTNTSMCVMLIQCWMLI